METVALKMSILACVLEMHFAVRPIQKTPGCSKGKMIEKFGDYNQPSALAEDLEQGRTRKNFGRNPDVLVKKAMI